jgi:hypothetical protein
MHSRAPISLTLGTLMVAAGGVRSATAGPGDPIAPLLLAGGTGLLLAGFFFIGSGSLTGRVVAALLSGAGVGVGLVWLVVVHVRQAGPQDAEALFLGLPPGAALTVYGLGLVPVVLFPLVFTLTERAAELDPEALEALRNSARHGRAPGGGGERGGRDTGVDRSDG